MSFNPRELGKLPVWLDAMDSASLTFNSTTISNWRNKGNRSVGDASNSTALNQPTYNATGIGGMPSLDFDSNDYMIIADSTGLDYTEMDLFVVCQRNVDSGGSQGILGKWDATFTNGGEFVLIVTNSDTLQLAVSASGASSPLGSCNGNALTISQGFIVNAHFNNAAQKVRMSSQRSVQVEGAATAIAATNKTLSIGRAHTAYFQGGISEFLMFGELLSLNNRRKVMRYLRAKYKIAGA